MLGGFVSYWQLPVISAATWFGTLLAMMIVWLAKGQPHYSTMSPSQHIAYISDIGATGLQPLFIAGSTVSVVVFDVAFISERWLRHKGRLAHNTLTSQKILSGFAIAFAIIGAIGLILLSILDVQNHHTAHDSCLGVFIVGYIISAIFICAEYERLGVRQPTYKILRISYYIKLGFIIVEIALAIAFLVMNRQVHYNRAAILEWTISLVYILYVLSFVIDFIPAAHSKHDRFPTVEEMRQADQNGPSVSGGPVYVEDGASRRAYAEGHPNGTGHGLEAPGTVGRDSYSSQQPMMQQQGEPQMYPTRAF